MPFYYNADWRRASREGIYYRGPEAPLTVGSLGDWGDWGDWGALPAAQAQPPAISVATGIDPAQVANALYGRIIPISILGLARIGTAGLIFGPYFNSGAASFGVSFGFPANPAGTRRVYEIALDGKVAWELAAGSGEGAIDPAGFLGDPFTCRFYSGTQTQPADPLEVAMFGAEAVAYRPQMTLWFSGLPIAPFDGKVPFVSCKIGDVTDGAVPADGVNLGDVLERVAYSPWVGLDSASFETDGIADIVQGMILTEDQSLLDLLQVTCRVYRTLDILQTDKLRVRDRGSTVTPDVVLHRDHVVADGGVQYLRAEEASVPRELELLTIDPDADYVFMPSKAVRPLTPVPVTSSVAKDSMTLPVVIDAQTRTSLVTYAKYQEDNARKRVSLTAMLYGYALEPGDLFRLTDIGAGFDNGEIWKVVESSHGANYVNEIVGEAILKCAIEFEEDAGDPILLLHANASPIVDDSSYAWTITTRGTPTIDTSVKKYGAASFLFDGTDDAIDTPTHNNTAWNISPTNTSPYTIELWARFADLPRAAQILLCRFSGFITSSWVLWVPNGLTDIRFQTYSDGSTLSAVTTTTAAGLVENTWYHIAVDKDSTGKVRIYVNGVMKASDTPLDSVIYNAVTSTTIGNHGLAVPGYNFVGNIDDVRITKGVSRYGDLFGNASFSPPGAQFPDPA